MKVAIYCRLSVEDEKKFGDSESIKNQLILLEDYVKNFDYEIYDYYIDDNYSGLDRNRPAFRRLIEDARNHYFEMVLCKNQSRFTRDLEIAEKYFHELFPLWGIRFIGVGDGVDTALRSGKKLRQLNGLINEWYCEDLSENIRMVLKTKMQHGQFIGSFACYGYVKGEHHQLEIDAPAADVVKQIFNWYENGDSMAKIARKLTDKKIPSPSEYKRQSGSSFRSPKMNDKWSVSTIKRILHDETYIGTLVQGRVSKMSCKSHYMKPVPKEEWIRIEDHHPFIIERRQFERVQEIAVQKQKRIL
jgi:DNA invertase Pin-like site-specific DNA recombinase